MPFAREDERLDDLRLLLFCAAVGVFVGYVTYASVVSSWYDHFYTTIWFGNALTLVACCSVAPKRRAIVGAAALVGISVAGYFAGAPPVSPLVLLIANILENVLMVRVAGAIDPHEGFRDLRALARFIGGCALAGPAITLAFTAAARLVAHEPVAPSELVGWYLSDVVGILMVYPLWLGARRRLSGLAPPPRPGETCAMYAVLGAVCYAAFYALRLPLLFCVMPIPVFAACRLGLFGTMGAVVITAGLAVHGTMIGRGALSLIVELFPYERVCLLQIFVFLTCLLALITHVVLAERNRYFADVQAVAARRRAVAEDRIFVGETSNALQGVFERERALRLAVDGLAARYDCRCAAFVEIDERFFQANAAGAGQPSIPDHHPFPLRRVTRNAFVHAGAHPGEPVIEPGYLLAPLHSEHVVVGIVALEPPREHKGGPLATQSLIDDFAKVVSAALDAVAYVERDRKTAQVLQHELLPIFLPQFPGVAVDALYVPPNDGLQIGGDWYDVGPMEDGRIFFSVGDVCGHGTNAAGLMGKIRAVIKTLVYTMGELEPAVRYLDYFLREYDVRMVTLCCGIVDPEAGTLQFINAGHPPLLVASAEDVVRLDQARTLPLGVIDDSPVPVHTVPLPPDAMIVGYTDGLFAPGRDIVAAELRLAAAVKRVYAMPAGGNPAGALRRAMLEKIVPADDTAILVLRVAPIEADFTLRQRVTPTNARALRRRTRLFAERHGFSTEQIRRLDVSIGEALDNVIEHAYDGRFGDVVYHCACDEEALLVRIADFGTWRPERKEGRGHGLAVMRDFCERVRLSHDENGTTVEFRMPRTLCESVL